MNPHEYGNFIGLDPSMSSSNCTSNDFCELTAWTLFFSNEFAGNWTLEHVVLAATGQGLAGFNLCHHFRNAGRGHIHVIVVSWRDPTRHPSRPADVAAPAFAATGLGAVQLCPETATGFFQAAS